MCLLLAGCSSAVRTERLASGPRTSSDEAPRSQQRGQDFTILPPETYAPLPPTLLLGAASLQERDDISETLIRHFANKPDSILEIRYRFIGFEGNESKEYDPSQEMLRRIRKVKLSIEPVSAFKESSRQNGERVESEQAEHAMTYIIFQIYPTSENQAEVDVNERPRFGAGGQRLTYSLLRKDRRWTITNEKPGPIF